MKLKLTESQYKLVQKINETQEAVSEMAAICKKISDETEKIYSKLMGVGLDDIIGLKINTSELLNHLNKLQNAVYAANKNAYNKLVSDDDGFDSFDIQIDDLKSDVLAKIESLELLLTSIEEMENVSRKFNISKKFKSTEPVDITSLQK